MIKVLKNKIEKAYSGHAIISILFNYGWYFTAGH